MALTVIVVALIGLIAGTAVNALADDLPFHRKPSLPHYSDNTPRPPIGWSGLLAFLTGKRASPNGAKLGWRYPLTEIGTIAAMLAVIFKTQDDSAMTTLQLGFWLLYMAIFVLIIVIDMEHRLILFAVMIPSAIIAILDAILTNYGPDLVGALEGGALGFGIFFLFYLGGFAFTWLIAKFRGTKIDEVAFGYGDVMLATLSGLILGWQPLPFALYIAVILGGIGAILYLVIRRLAGHKYAKYTAIPYGPFIVAGTFFVLLFSPVLFRMVR